MHFNDSAVSGEVGRHGWGPFDQHQHHQVHVSKISSLERDTLGLYTMYISNLDPTWRILFEHLHLKGTVLIFEVVLELRWVDFSFFLFSPFCAFNYFYVTRSWESTLYFYNWKLNKGKKLKNAMMYHWKALHLFFFWYNLLKRLPWHSYWCKTKGW